MDKEDIINGKYLPILMYLEDKRGKDFPHLKQKEIAKMTNCSVRSLRDYLTCKKVNWNWLFQYAYILNTSINFTVNDLLSWKR